MDNSEWWQQQREQWQQGWQQQWWRQGRQRQQWQQRQQRWGQRQLYLFDGPFEPEDL